MEPYPADYVVHNLPLVILSGLEPSKAETPIGEITQEFLGDGGFRIRAELAPLHHPLTKDLRATLLSYDRSDAPWRSQSTDKTEQIHAFKIRSVGRAYTLPPRKAPPPPHSPRLRPANDNGLSPAPLTLHSTLSPLSPSSPLYPDGIITPLWITKHQHRLPSVLVSFYNLVADSGTSSLEDNKLKAEINNIRSLISSTNYKTKFVIVLVADGPINHTELEERLVNIRRGTNFDTKALYYLPSASSQAELNDFAKVLFSTIHPTSIEYYRDLSKHARRKRNRNVVPQPTVQPTQGTSSVLSLQGWNVRYEFKLGIFAETRQELEAASRNFEQAYEGLFHSELLGDAISAYSSRFDEARMLADVIAMRLIRCSFWSSQTATAVKWWMSHRDRIQDLVDRRGKGTTNYGWEAWQSTWTRVMAELVERSDIFEAATSQLPPGTLPLVQILPPKVATSIDRQLPWEFLHHEGYWLNIVCKHIRTRREHALLITEEDIVNPYGSTTQRNKKASPHDTYLSPEPAFEQRLLEKNGDNYTRRICSTIDDSIKTFQPRDQSRMVEMLQLRQSQEYHNSQKWSETISILKSLWDKSSWRSQGWWKPLFDVGEALLRAAVETKDHELCLRLIWELAAVQRRRDGSDLFQTTEALSTALDLKSTLPVLTTSFAFASDSGHVGEPIPVQLSLSSSIAVLPMALQIHEVKIAFDGGINPILLTTKNDEQITNQSKSTTISYVELSEANASPEKQVKRLSVAGTSYLTGAADFDLSAGLTKVLNFEVVPQEAGPVSVASIMILLRNGSHELTLDVTDVDGNDAAWWEIRNGQPECRDFGMHRDVTTMNVLPKPPKLDIKIPGLRPAYYTNETLELQVELFNGEQDEVTGQLEARLISPASGTIDLRWKHDDTPATVRDADIKEVVLPAAEVETLGAGTFRTYTISISGLTDSIDHELDIKATCALPGNTASTSTKQLIVDLPIIRPFEVNAVFMPRLHQERWPDFFATPDITADLAQGIRQKYLVRADIACFAQEALTIHSLELKARRIVGGVTFTASVGRIKTDKAGVPDTVPDGAIRMLHERTEQFLFDLEMQKLSLGDRSPVAVDSAINIRWSRSDSEEVNTSTLVLPRFLAPMSEPRVLLRTSKMVQKPGMHLLSYTIENPSMHFLTFNLTMDGGEGLAFSGPKLKSVSLVPISRYDISYHIYVQKSNEWVRVQLEVLDAFFGQTLKVQPASKGVRIDKLGNVQVWAEE
ncbi:hypothetical protein PMZ80_000624 [Knufia obscura]|uniref:Trafficking protein particle complex subunit 11 n=1 Tax=Knufia obscura TaxID=1635080 RepID=A0ABR0S0X3_9EURO|nr:hypothetical protein PMZ80_000624 [Knufia obscura]